MDFTQEVILILIGASISLTSTFLLIILDYFLRARGKIRVYVKHVTNVIDSKPAGITNDVLSVPLWIEIHNSRNVPIILRDFSIYLLNNGEQVYKMKQVNEAKTKGGITELFGRNGAYSFLVDSKSIEQFKLLFMLKKTEYTDTFNELKIVYFNESNRKITYNLILTPKSWESSFFELDKEWKLLT